MAKLTELTPVEPVFSLELSLREAAMLRKLIGATAGDAVELTRIYQALDDRRIIAKADASFTYTDDGHPPRMDRKD